MRTFDAEPLRELLPAPGGRDRFAEEYANRFGLTKRQAQRDLAIIRQRSEIRDEIVDRFLTFVEIHPDQVYGVGQKCGTIAGYSQHLRDGDPPCIRCKRAKAAYQRELRRIHGHGDRPESLRRYRHAVGRAFKRLRDLHPEEYRQLVREELQRDHEQAEEQSA